MPRFGHDRHVVGYILCVLGSGYFSRMKRVRDDDVMQSVWEKRRAALFSSKAAADDFKDQLVPGVQGKV